MVWLKIEDIQKNRAVMSVRCCGSVERKRKETGTFADQTCVRV